MNDHHPGKRFDLSYEAYRLYCAIMDEAGWWDGQSVYAHRADPRIRLDPTYMTDGHTTLDSEQLLRVRQELVDKKFILLSRDQYGTVMYYTGSRTDLQRQMSEDSRFDSHPEEEVLLPRKTSDAHTLPPTSPELLASKAKRTIS